MACLPDAASTSIKTCSALLRSWYSSTRTWSKRPAGRRRTTTASRSAASWRTPWGASASLVAALGHARPVAAHACHSVWFKERCPLAGLLTPVDNSRRVEHRGPSRVRQHKRQVGNEHEGGGLRAPPDGAGRPAPVLTHPP